MGPSQDLLGQLWKEYAKSDSRYLIADPFVVSIEAVTVVSFPMYTAGSGLIYQLPAAELTP